ncbi:tyrosine-type recombinase/integrase [Bacillus sp. DTU_2020_1000418_1_SI_GHA_SEK_038]|uniref:tyrosine-type recombinase/integrase n=1 Tax=Bacillus sp. DTU_2020_1000418_1_SI_GHA_SEK_038 TaxID=3077585 RepID=UPI0028E5639F|nr:tyrosine-type recombinase/integrase [Bacillus sp. DTU_2020_1000418_1_SI_GHA_SEK_038]WNS77334.1 tyrosine-type recombinase/integrase [Bacillus sp. DTU_2020_1000418_1_SI_GHA_SEK_038]
MTNYSGEVIPLILDFCKWLVEQNKSANTVKTYGRELERFQEWLQKNDSDLNHLRKSDIKYYITHLEQQQKSLATIDKIVGVIRTFAKYLQQPELTFGIELKPVVRNEEFETLSDAQYQVLIEKVYRNSDLRDRAIVYILLHTGIRVSELCNLNWEHVNFEKNEITIEKEEERRAIPLSKDAREHLNEYFRVHPLKQQAIFISKTGNRLTERTIQYMLKNYDVTPNQLRHTFCQRLVDSNVDLEVVSKLAGIKDLNLIKRYVKSPEVNRGLEEVINNAFINNTLG